jgi:hypothetical protein
LFPCSQYDVHVPKDAASNFQSQHEDADLFDLNNSCNSSHIPITRQIGKRYALASLQMPSLGDL